MLSRPCRKRSTHTHLLYATLLCNSSGDTYSAVPTKEFAFSISYTMNQWTIYKHVD